MGWEEELFAVLDDLEQQAEGLFAADRDRDLQDRSRAEYHRVTLASRLMASVGRELAVDVVGVGQLAGTLRRVGRGWCLLGGGGQDWVVRTAAVVAVHDASERSTPEVAWSPVTRLGFGAALRRLSEAGERCVVHTTDGGRYDVHLRRVGEDFVEAVAGAGRDLLLAFPAVAAVQSRA